MAATMSLWSFFAAATGATIQPLSWKVATQLVAPAGDPSATCGVMTVLPHPLTADVVRYVQAQLEQSDRAGAAEALNLMDRALTSRDDRLENAVAVAFVEWFQPGLEQSWPSFLPREVGAVPRPFRGGRKQGVTSRPARAVSGPSEHWLTVARWGVQ
jgi:hypothetical protein